MSLDLKCQRCGHKQAAYHMHDIGTGDVHCSNMYKCLVRRMERVELTVKRHGSMLREHDGKLFQEKEPTGYPPMEWEDTKVGGTD